jgi:hypothetical protein
MLPDPGLERRYRLYCAWMAGLTLVMVAALLAVTYAVDPYAESERDQGFYFASRPTTVVRYRALLRESPHALVFGTSRSHMVSDRFLGEPVLNLHAIYGNPLAVEHFLGGLDQVQAAHVTRVVYLLDLHVFADQDYLTLDYYEGNLSNLWYRLSNLWPYLVDSYQRVALNIRGNPRFHLDRQGYLVQNLPAVTSGTPEEPKGILFGNNAFKALASIHEYCSKHNIPIEFITPTLLDSNFARYDIEEVIAQRRRFIEILGSYIELTSIPGISERIELFRDDSHLNREGMGELFRLAPWAEFRVDRTNAEATWQGLRERHAAARAKG